jgi:NAD-dependent dihydropyrimidine dehydrogenase PreA subunit
MLRNIITIDEKLCDGCGDCVNSCVEGALQIIEGKAKLISELYCDGLGACVGDCHTGAIKVIEKDCEAYDEVRTLQNIIPQGVKVVMAHLQHLYRHGQNEYLKSAIAYLEPLGYSIPNELFEAKPVNQTRKISLPVLENTEPQCGCSSEEQLESKLDNWPIQLHLINPASGVFDGADVLFAADCVPFAYPDFHNTFMKDKPLMIACPKLDSNKEAYLNKLVMLLTEREIRSITVVIMEVPCCGGLLQIVKKAMEYAGSEIPLKFFVIGIEGKIVHSK